MGDQGSEESSFADLFTYWMNAANFGPDTLSQAVEAKFGSGLLPRSTIISWRKGLATRPRASSWEALAAALHVLGVDKNAANRVLQAAGLKSVDELRQLYSESERARQILEIWQAGNDSQSKMLLPSREPVFVSALKPLSYKQRELIKESRAIFSVGINLLRLFSAFQLEFRHMLSQGGIFRTVLSHPEGAAMSMAALRSESRTPEAIQRERLLQTLDLLALWKRNLPEAKIGVRLLDYLPPYGITIMYPANEIQPARCLVRLFSFRVSTAESPSFDITSDENPIWLAFFREQFDQMWAAGEDYAL